MNEHLKRKHPVETNQAPKPKQLKLDTYTARKTCTKKRSNHINTLVMGMIVHDLRSLNTVNGAGFKALLSYLEPGYRLPSDRYFTGLIERKYVDVRESVKLRQQQETACVSITGDIWTSIATHAYLTLTDWWKVNGHRFPLLARLSRKYLAITATSTPAERVFSVAGLIVSRLRASLSPEHVDMLVFLNKNMDLKVDS